MQDQHGRWIPDLSPRGYEVFNNYKRFLLVEGPRKSTKTINVVNKIARHLWENDGAIVAIIGKTLRNIKSSGVWQDLTKLECGIPQWIKAGIGFKYTTEPKITGDTKMTFFRIRNMHGGESECQVHSLEHEQEVETKFKSTRYSMIYLPEADQFKDRYTFDILEDQLRVIGIPQSEHQLIADCNPPREGPDHWIHDLWFKQIDPDGQPVEPALMSKLFRIHFDLDDNPFMSKDEKETLRAKYRHDKNAYARLVEGKWVKDSAEGHFKDYFIEGFHVRGVSSSPDKANWHILVPSSNCLSILVGWDPGDVNHAVSFIAPRDVGEQAVFDVIDEVVVLNRRVSLSEFTGLVTDQMDFWESVVKELYGRDKIKWIHRADFSVMAYKSAADMTDALIVQQASDGRIVLRGVPKLRHSVNTRLSLVKRLLFEDRLFVSSPCHHHIDMLRHLRPGRTRNNTLSKTDLIEAKSEYKHVFDSLTYPLLEEVPEDIQRRSEPQVRGKLVSVSMV